MSDQLEAPARIVDALARQLYARALARNSYSVGWPELEREQRDKWMEEARYLIAPIYREILDDLERRLMQPRVVSAAIKAFHRPRLKDQELIEEALHAAWQRAIRTIPPRRTLEEAVRRLRLAGKEMGKNMASAAARIGPGPVAMGKLGFKEPARAPAAIGIALGLLMQGDSETVDELEKIELERQEKELV